MWFDKKEETLLSSKQPLQQFFNDSTLITKNAELCKVFKIGGKEYTGLDVEELERLQKLRSSVVEKFDERVFLITHSHRVKQHIKQERKEDKNYQAKVNNLWIEQFIESYHTNHYIVISTNSITKLSDMSVFDSIGVVKINDKHSTIEKNSNIIRTQFKEFNVSELESEELVSFFSSYLAGRELNQRINKEIFFDDYILESNISFPQGKNYMIYEGVSTTYAKWISISFFDNDNFNSSMIEQIMSYNATLSLYQSILKLNKEVAKELIKKKLDNTKSFLSSEESEDELDEFKNDIDQQKKTLFYYTFSIQIKHNNLKILHTQVRDIQAIVDSYGYRTIVENTNIEPIFWSILPTYELLNSRKRLLDNSAIAELNTFTSVAQGLENCSWGDEPITHFYNNHNGIYDFVLHKDTSPLSLGHTLVIGGTGSGKTTLIEFLMLMSTKYKDMKILALDKLQGIRVFTEFYDGQYVDFKSKFGMNPFQLEDNSANREFLKTFLQLMSGKYDPISEKRIENAVKDNFEHLEFSERNFKNIFTSFGSQQNEDDLVVALESWAFGSNAQYFSNEHDSLNFKAMINAFNMDSVFHNERATSLIAMYMFHKLKDKVTSEPSPFIVFIDELVSYIKNEDFAHKIVEILLEYRKLDGIVIGAIQDYKYLINNKIGDEILGGSFANIILYPDSTVDEKYKDRLGLTSSEFNFIKNSTDKHKILFKRVGGSSVILDVDLSKLGNYLKTFDSSSRAVNLIKNLKSTYPTTWKEVYLNV